MLAGKKDIIQYIPQRAPVVMVHELLEVDETNAKTNLTIQDENIFVAEGVLAECGLIENIAQTAAVHVGFLCRQQNIPVPIGYIAMVKELEIFRQPAVNETVQTSIRLINKVMDITLVGGTVTMGEDVICTCELRIFTKSE